jgi:hypothetical protein
LRPAEVRRMMNTYLSFLRKNSYNETFAQLEPLIAYWEKQGGKMPIDLETTLRQSFNQIKAVTTREEFRDRIGSESSYEFFDGIDNLFSRLTRKRPVGELLMGTTEIMNSLREADTKLKTIRTLMNTAQPPANFYVLCFLFMLAMESYYDELVRFVYAAEKLMSTGQMPQADELRFKPVSEMKESISVGSKAVLGIWERGHRIRNAVAHATFYYDDSAKNMRFFDVDTKSKRVKSEAFTHADVAELYRKIGIIGAALHVLLALLIIYTLLTTPPDRIIVVR